LPILAVCVVSIGLVMVILFYNPQAAAHQQALTNLNVVNTTGLADAVYQKIQSQLMALATSSPADTTTSTGSGNSIATAAKPLTATEALSQEFINQYMTMKQSGQTLTPDEESSLIPNLIQNGDVTNHIPQAKVFTIADIVVINNTSAAAFHAYGNAVGAVVARNSVPQNLNELDILQAAVNSGNPDDLANLAIITKSYSGIIKGLSTVPVPSSVAALHLAILNDFSQAENSVEGMQKLFTDPVFTVSAVQNYEQVAPAIYNDISALGPLFAKNGITFGPTEPGYRFIAASTQ